MIVELLGLTAIAAASGSDIAARRKRIAAELALGRAPNLGELIDIHGLKWVADRVNAIPDTSPKKELLLRALENWVGRTVLVGSWEEAWATQEADIRRSAGAELTIFRLQLAGWADNSFVDMGRPARVRVLGIAEPGEGGDRLESNWFVKPLGKESHLSGHELAGPIYRVKAK
jgi:hypothetical protein